MCLVILAQGSRRTAFALPPITSNNHSQAKTIKMPTQKQKPSLTAEAVLQTLRELFPTLQQQYQIQTLGLFGSVSRNEATETSDIDLLIELQPDITYGLITFCHLENILSEALGQKVDLVIKENLKPSLRENIIQEVIYL
jgi:predicted nucleotidyltransferase